ncbi:MAG: hypothetical protein QXJ28_00265, partial [Candidatus Pacearchaeota archaeon]
ANKRIWGVSGWRYTGPSEVGTYTKRSSCSEINSYLNQDFFVIPIISGSLCPATAKSKVIRIFNRTI